MSPPKIKQLIHNGVLIPAYEPKGFNIRYKGKELGLILWMGCRHQNTFGALSPHENRLKQHINHRLRSKNEQSKF